jgi:hypothetical protein
MMTNSDRILRFEGAPQNNVPEDVHRKFIIEVFLSDDTIGVGEVKIRNSGCWEGKFRKRGLTSNPAAGRNFLPSDFFVGAEVSLSAMPMLITRADEYTLKYMEANPSEFPQSSIGLLCLKLSPLLKGSPPAPMAPEEFGAYVQKEIGIDLSEQELITLLRACSKPDTAEIVGSDLFDLIRKSATDAPRKVG